MGCGAPRGAAHGVGRAGQDDPETVRKAGRFGTWHAPALRNHVPGRVRGHALASSGTMRSDACRTEDEVRRGLEARMMSADSKTMNRSEERSVGKECVSKGRSRCEPST